MPKTSATTKLLIIVGLLVSAFVLNPSAERHRTIIKETIAERSQVDRMFGVGPLTAFSSRYHNLYIASYTTVDDELQSVGLFWLVLVAE
jgi:hypothetical protein